MLSWGQEKRQGWRTGRREADSERSHIATSAASWDMSLPYFQCLFFIFDRAILTQMVSILHMQPMTYGLPVNVVQWITRHATIHTVRQTE